MKNSICLAFILFINFASLLVVSCKSYDGDFNFALLKAECGASIEMYNDNPYIVLMPENPKAGFIFYPGGLVSYEAYLPLLVKCAKNGIACVLIQMPSDFAILNLNAAVRVQKRFTQVADWYIGGHSLGGAMAATYVSSCAEKFRGLVLLAAYSTSDLTSTKLKVLSVYGNKDGVLNMEKYAKYRSNLPQNFTEIVIEGGNHGNFGSYGNQKGDGDALIAADVQQEITANAINSLVEQ